jgi:hypothetical protein
VWFQTHFPVQVPELRTVIGESNVIEFETKLRSFKDDKSVKEALQRIFHLLMTADPKLVKNELDRLVSRLKEQTDHFSKTVHNSTMNFFVIDISIISYSFSLDKMCPFHFYCDCVRLCEASASAQ